MWFPDIFLLYWKDKVLIFQFICAVSMQPTQLKLFRFSRLNHEHAFKNGTADQSECWSRPQEAQKCLMNWKTRHIFKEKIQEQNIFLKLWYKLKYATKEFYYQATSILSTFAILKSKRRAFLVEWYKNKPIFLYMEGT